VRRSHDVVVSAEAGQRTRVDHATSAFDPKQTMPQRSASPAFTYIASLAPLSVANTSSLIRIGLGAGVVGLCLPEKQGKATFQGRLAASSPIGLGQPVKRGTG